MTIIYNYTLLYRKNTYIVIRIFMGKNIILYKCHMEYIYACIIPLSLIFSMHGVAVYGETWRNCPGAKLLFTPEQHGREVEHSLWALRTTPHTYYGCCTLSGLPSESKARSFSQKLNVVHASLREWGLLSASATWSIRSLGKSTASYIFVYIYIAVLAYYSLYLLFAIRLYIFFYIYISVSVSYVQPQFF